MTSTESRAIPLDKANNRKGFTLIELSIVLVIIGLIVGGVLVGRDLISAASMRAQLQQIEKYQVAVNTFRGKYGYLPGDIPNPDAINFGFASRGIYAGQGDGNGVIEGVSLNAASRNFGYVFGAGEIPMFWVDLAFARLIDATFTAGSPSTPPGAAVTGTNIVNYMPKAKFGQNNYIYVYSNNLVACCGYDTYYATNFFGLSAVTSLNPSAPSCSWCMASNVSLTVAQAHNMDQKVDDGRPTRGKVYARFADYQTSSSVAMSANAATSSATTCYDSTNYNYSLDYNNGAGVNCALSFKFQ